MKRGEEKVSKEKRNILVCVCVCVCVCLCVSSHALHLPAVMDFHTGTIKHTVEIAVCLCVFKSVCVCVHVCDCVCVGVWVGVCLYVHAFILLC